ncbi:UPF0223 family protein [Staphylococcus sp. SUC_1.2]|uniref:UPF0223 family protein n=1 Tax=Staphylococcus TaxID=1279 RepID=UPI00065F9E15|nr:MULTISPECIES: UPF0223 family protein [Staphylococcus]MCI3144130.1 UPF0223 family protein [Staphylococcus hominis subsp. hominis]MCW9141651.1 UPF0223 family protein [Staphylococcus sp. SUC_1.2]OHO30111.1 hypothetical protein HMPREF2629_09105 [Staphylococcus sp. HMSC034C12]
MEYQYPLDLDWSNEEMVDVIKFFNQIENYYEKSIIGTELMKQYKKFKQIVPSKAEEKQIFKEFEEKSGYNSYKVIQEVKKNPDRENFSKH